jgi:ribonuclease BN (tRNA processing enzyme)
MGCCVDGGTGFMQLSMDFLMANKKQINMLLTHHHHDHNQGILPAPTTHAAWDKGIKTRIFGPIEKKEGAKQVISDLMRPPKFPVHFDKVKNNFIFNQYENPDIYVILFHREGGMKILELSAYRSLLERGKKIPFDSGSAYWKQDCLVVTTYRSNHPEETISYRFEEGPTGKVGVILTDHENDGISSDLRAHVRDADLLIMDCQYTPEQYVRMTSGWGHATYPYCVKLAAENGVKKLMFTHHDPFSNDAKIYSIVEEAKLLNTSPILDIASCKDFEVYVA